MNRLNIFLTVLLLMGIGLYLGLGWNPKVRNWEFLPDMARSAAYESQGPNSVFADGKTLQAPVPGTIARGLLPFHYGATDEEAARAGRELANPFAEDDTVALARGAEVWKTFCVVCHGAGGEGNGPATARGVPIPPSLFTEQAIGRKEGEIFSFITTGKNNLNMPSYASQISVLDRWRVTTYLKALQRQKRT